MSERWLDDEHPLRRWINHYILRMREEKHHVQLDYDQDGNPILGLKRCRFCGLSTTYWERFPVCESKSVSRRITKQVRPLEREREQKK